MSDNTPYQFPAQHDQAVQRFIKIMAIGGFSLLLLVGLLFYYADRLLLHLPFSTEQALVRPYEKLISRYWPDNPDTAPQERYLQTLADQLSLALPLPEGMRVTVHYIEHDQANAFATLGGHIVIFSGLLTQVESENALAMVLAHEIAHIKHRDPLVMLSRGALVQLAYGLVSGSTGMGGELFNQGSEVGLLSFSREQERAADQAAVHALQRYYGHVAGATDFFRASLHQQRAQQDNAEAVPHWLSSHPELDERIEQINQLAAQQGWQTADVTPLPALF